MVPGEWEGCRVIDLPVPYRFDTPMYTDQDDEDDATPDLLLPPYFHSHHDMMLTPRLNLLDPAIQNVS